MATRYPRVNPGDLIKSTFVNGLLEALEKLEDRVKVLEEKTPGDAVVITSITSNGQLVSGPVEFETRIEINGLNFTVPAVLNQVYIGGAPVTDFKGSSTDKSLVLDVPTVPGTPDAGAMVPVVVKNQRGSVGVSSMIVKPKVAIPTGDLFVTYARPPVMAVGHPNIESTSPTPSSYVFTFNIAANADLPGKYLVAATSSTPGWQVDVLEDNSDVPRASNVVPLANKGNQDIRVRVTVPGGLSAGASTIISFAANETSPGTKLVGQAQIKLVVGSPPPAPDTRVRVALGPVQNGASLVGSRVVFKRGQTGVVTFNFTIAEAGKYDVSFSMRGVASPSAATWQFINQDTSQINATGPISPNVSVAWKAGSGATATDMIVSIRRPDANPAVTIDYAQPVGVVDP